MEITHRTRTLTEAIVDGGTFETMDDPADSKPYSSVPYIGLTDIYAFFTQFVTSNEEFSMSIWIEQAVW
jgi:hypothetical protein